MAGNRRHLPNQDTPSATPSDEPGANQAKQTKGRKDERRPLGTPADETNHHRAQFLHAIEKVLPEVLVDLYQNVYPLRAAKDLDPAIDAWANRNRLSAKYTNPEFGKWVVWAAKLTVYWWENSRQTSFEMATAKPGTRPVSINDLEWQSRFPRFGLGGSVIVGDSQPPPDPWSVAYKTSWYPRDESLEKAKLRIRTGFDAFLRSRLLEIQAATAAQYGVRPVTEKPFPQHYEWVALNQIRPEDNGFDRLASRSKASQNTIRCKIAETKILIGMNRGRGRPAP